MFGALLRCALVVCVVGTLFFPIPWSWADTADAPSTSETGEALRMAQLEDELVDLQSRFQLAENRRARAAQYFSGQLPLEGAFPDWSEQSLDDPGLLLGLQLELNQRMAERAEERILIPSYIEEDETSVRWMQLREAAFYEEDQADLAALRFLGFVRDAKPG